jgi:hypothetical protein
MSSSLVGLEHLRYLDLSCNNFSSASIPKFICSLKSLFFCEIAPLKVLNTSTFLVPYLGEECLRS